MTLLPWLLRGKGASIEKVARLQVHQAAGAPATFRHHSEGGRRRPGTWLMRMAGFSRPAPPRRTWALRPKCKLRYLLETLDKPCPIRSQWLMLIESVLERPVGPLPFRRSRRSEADVTKAQADQDPPCRRNAALLLLLMYALPVPYGGLDLRLCGFLARSWHLAGRRRSWGWALSSISGGGRIVQMAKDKRNRVLQILAKMSSRSRT